MIDERLDRRTVLKGGAVSALALGAAASTAETPPLRTRAVKVAFVIDEGANVMDLAGPWEVFQDAVEGHDYPFALYSVASKAEPIRTTGTSLGGLKLTPHVTFGDAPPPDVVVIGAQGNGGAAEKLEWIRAAARSGAIVMSVCTGAFVLARTGLLDGRTATTHHNFMDDFEKEFPKVRLIRTARFIDHGQLVTAGGLTSGIDAALHVVARLKGEALATEIADYMEYHGQGWREGVKPV